MIVVLEGADASGKTTLARYLRDEYAARYLHLGPAADVYRLHLAAYNRARRLDSADGVVVVDRHWPSECAYGEVYRGGSAYPVAARCFDRLWLRAAAVYVLCAPLDLERQIRDHYARDLSKKGNRYARDRARDVRPVVEYYHDLRVGSFAVPESRTSYLANFARRGDWPDWPNVVVYDRFEEGHDLKSVADRILTAARAFREQQHPLGFDHRAAGYAGHWGVARWLIAGIPSPSSIIRPDLAFPFVDRCSHESPATYLNRALHEIDVPESVLMWTNVRGVATTADSREITGLANDHRVRNLPTIALGAVAEQTLRRLGFPNVRRIPHPAWSLICERPATYARRFEEALFS